MSGFMKDLEILSTGTWEASTGRITITDEDLDQIIESFDALTGSNIVRPHLKLGHTEAQRFFGQEDGIPALGWITSLKRVGRKLLADVSDIPDALMDLIKQRRFHNVSVELFGSSNRPVVHEGRNFSRVLSAVALLGVEMPAVKDLAGVAAALFKDGPLHQFSDAAEGLVITTNETEVKAKDIEMPEKTDDLRYTQEQVDSLIEAAVQKAVTEAKSELSAEVDSLKSEQTVLTQRAETAESKLSEQLKAQEIDAANGLIDEAIKSGKLLPKQRTFALAALTALKDQTIKLSSDDGPRDMSMAEAFREFLSEAGVVVDKATHTDVDDDADADRDKSYVSATQELDAKVKMALKESPDRFKTYGEAFDFVLSDDEKLAARYHSETITTVQ